MRLMTWILSCFFLFSCTINHTVWIPKPPCLYPFVDYDFTLCQEFKYNIDGIWKTIPEGFTTDLASIPKIFWSIYSPNKANTIPAAVIHDYLYFCPGDLTREQADSIFYAALIYKHVGAITAYKYWAVARLFGKSHFNEGAVCNYSLTRIKNSKGQHRRKVIT